VDPDQWQQLRPLFDRAIDLDDESRSLFLAEVRARDGALHDELVRLLRGQERLKADVSRNAMDLVAPSMVQAIEEEASIDQRRVGECVGPYRLIRLLGAGGMGAVYLAERSDGKFGHRVALKIVRGGFASPSARERFERERSVLAGLHHSGIAQLFDGGETREGQPFYTMEFVEGVPITEYCDGSVSASARLRVLLQVASALGHAHQNLVVHRDIKPSNVLVDASGNAKLVDFGLAKSLETGPERMLTMAGAGPMTPAYAAPEQFHNAPVTVATDVYQFGVLCYFVLARRLPYRADPNDAFEWARAVSTEEPLLLSQARERAGQSEGEADSKGSGRNLGRDLDAIVRKALAKNPAQRYRSVDAMAADIEAFLDGRPVTARRATPGYFAWRFVQRWRYAVAATGLAFIALAATTLFEAGQGRGRSCEFGFDLSHQSVSGVRSGRESRRAAQCKSDSGAGRRTPRA
jgi:serine/threonine-protein kinase